MRSYHVAAASVALECSQKWLDNILSKHAVQGIERERQGRARRISPDGLLRLAVIRMLVGELDLPSARAVSLASVICASADGEAETAGGCRLRIDLAALRQEVMLRMREAVETTVPARRGRPPRRHAPE